MPSTDPVSFVELAAREEPCIPKGATDLVMRYPVRQDSIRLIGTGSGAFGDMEILCGSFEPWAPHLWVAEAKYLFLANTFSIPEGS